MAGTRQQSRLIAMMSDYDRVLELQQTSLRSSGATVAQLTTYLEGMEAATNRVNVAIEKITTAFTNSDWIISIINGFANVADFIGSALQNEGAMVTVTTGLIVVLGAMLTLRIQQTAQQAKQVKYQANLNQLAKIAQYQQQRSLVIELQKQAALLAQTIEKKKQNKESTAIEENELKNLNARITAESSKVAVYEQQAIAAGAVVDQQAKYNDAAGTGLQISNDVLTATQGWSGAFMQASTALSAFIGVYRLFGAIKDARHKKDLAQAGKETAANGTAGFAKIVAQAGIPGIAVGLAFLAALGIAAAVSITGAINSSSNAEDNAADSISRLSTEIYQLSTTANELQTVIDTYDELDRKIIKTTEDQEEMTSTLEEAADKLSDEQKEIYNSLTTNQQKIDYIRKAREEDLAKIESDRQKQLNELKNNSGLLTGTSDDAVKVQSAVYAAANQKLYDYDDKMGYDSDTESLVQKMLESMSPTEVYRYVLNPEKIEALADSVAELDIAGTLLSSSSSLMDVVAAYQSASGEVKGLLDQIYPQLSTLSSWGSELLT